MCGVCVCVCVCVCVVCGLAYLGSGDHLLHLGQVIDEVLWIKSQHLQSRMIHKLSCIAILKRYKLSPPPHSHSEKASDIIPFDNVIICKFPPTHINFKGYKLSFTPTHNTHLYG